MPGRVETVPASTARRAAAREQEMDRLFTEAFPPEKRQAVLAHLAERAEQGDVRVAAFLFDRLYGRPGATGKFADAEDLHEPRHDLSRLEDREVVELARLLEKCTIPADSPLDAEEGRAGASEAALSR